LTQRSDLAAIYFGCDDLKNILQANYYMKSNEIQAGTFTGYGPGDIYEIDIRPNKQAS
jgi:hypothetical protein